MSTPGTAAEPFTLLRTKLHKPQVRPDWVRRPRLVERLNQGLDRKLTLVSAPAGYGKTTLLAQWLEGQDNVEWVNYPGLKSHPDYEKARQSETQAVQHGDYNFPGIGKPSDL